MRHLTTYRAAVIGVGNMASTIDDGVGRYDPPPLPYGHIACYSTVPQIELVGMCDTWPEQREAARQKWNFDAIYGDYRQMLAETRPDIVSVTTITRPRADIMLEIANGGYGVKAIWAEKPITFSLEQADRVIQACRREGIVLAVNAARRWEDAYVQALRMVQDGLIGEVLHVQAFGQCHLSHNGSHLLTTLTMYAGGRAAWVVGEAESDEAVAGDDDFAGAGYLGFPNGVRGYFRGMCNGPNEWAFDITGTTGMLRLMNQAQAIEHWTLEQPPEGMRGLVPARRFFPPSPRRHARGVNAIHDLMECIETGADPRCTGEDAREALEIAIATRESHRRGNVRVDLPLEDRSLQIISKEAVSDVPLLIQRRRAAEQAQG